MHDLEHFKFYAQKVLPMVYDESLSYYEVLAKVVHYLNEVIDNQVELETLFGTSSQEIAKLKKDVEFLMSEFQKIKDGTYFSFYIDSLAQWIDANLQELVAKIVKYVFFYLDDTGHFCADIPDSWDFLHFDTIEDPESENFGCLTFSWE